MAWSLVRYIWRLPNASPTASTIISGIVGLITVIYGIALTSTPAQNGQSTGLLMIFLGLLIAGLTFYAAYDTSYFRNWSRPSGNYGHRIIRWLGPVCIILAIIEFVIAWWIITIALEGMARR